MIGAIWVKDFGLFVPGLAAGAVLLSDIMGEILAASEKIAGPVRGFGEN